MTMKRTWILLPLVLLCAAQLPAADAFMPRWPAISPDGATVVFSFQGDLWRVPAAGGEAVRLTAHEAYDSHPVFSPDGNLIAFSSDRYGDADVFTMPLDGGRPRRLTYAGSTDRPRAFSADGRQVYFASRRLFQFPMSAQMWRVPVAGGTPFRLADVFMDEVATDGPDAFVYAEGRVAFGRRHYRGSYQREIYRWAPGGDPLRLTDNLGYDTNPMVAPGGRIFWLSDQGPDATANVWTMNADGTDKRQVTEFKNQDVRKAALSANGLHLVLERDTSLYVMEIGDSKPHRLTITVADDQIENPVIVETKSGDADELAVSDDGEEYAMTIEGEMVLVNRELGGRAVVLEPGEFLEQSVSFRPGSSDTLLYVSDREGEDAIYLLVADDPDEPNLRLARGRRAIRLSQGKEPCTNPVWSPDGKRILYTRGNGDLHVMDQDGKHDLTLFEYWNVGDYSWSPDGAWVAFSRSDANYNSDIFLIPSQGGAAINVTRHPDYDEGPVWSADGRVLAWSTSRKDHAPDSVTYDVYALYLRREDHERTREQWKILEKTRDKKADKKKDGPDEDNGKKGGDKEKAAEDKTAKVIIDFEDLYLRARRITKTPGTERVVAVDPEGDRYYFVGATQDGRDLKSVDRFGEDPQDITEGGADPAAITMDAEGETFTFLKHGVPARVPADGGKIKTTDFTARLVLDRPAIRLQVMDEAWRTLRDRYYDPDMHGVDWPEMRVRYEAMVRGVRNDVDFGDVMNLMLGELNSSHMGFRAKWDKHGDYGPDGWLGLDFDPAYEGAGLLVREVVPYGPCDKAAGRVLPGDVLLAVEGAPVGRGANVYHDLETREKLPTRLTLKRDDEERRIEVVPVSYRTIWQRVYEQTERTKRAAVEAASDGRVGYVHIQGMGFSEVERFEQNLFAAADGKEALIIDVRNNGGGWTTDLLLTILTQPVHAYTIGRDGEVGYPETERQPFTSWSRPIAVICNEGSYSNAEIFSHAIKTLGRGPVVGAETGGNVISTGAFGNRYKGYVRLPGRGWYVFGDKAHPERNHKPEEAQDEKTGCVPDYVVPLTPADRLHGRDPQLDKAVELMVAAAARWEREPQAEDSPYLK